MLRVQHQRATADLSYCGRSGADRADGGRPAAVGTAGRWHPLHGIPADGLCVREGHQKARQRVWQNGDGGPTSAVA